MKLVPIRSADLRSPNPNPMFDWKYIGSIENSNAFFYEMHETKREQLTSAYIAAACELGDTRFKCTDEADLLKNGNRIVSCAVEEVNVHLNSMHALQQNLAFEVMTVAKEGRPIYSSVMLVIDYADALLASYRVKPNIALRLLSMP